MDQQSLVDALRRGGNWLSGQFSLDTPQQDLVSPETAGDVALGFIPGVGQAMAVRDIARAYKNDDYLGMGLAAAGLIPGGKLVGALRNRAEAFGSAEKMIHLPGMEDRLNVFDQLKNEAQKGNLNVDPNSRDFRNLAWGRTKLIQDPTGAVQAEISPSKFQMASQGTYHEGPLQDKIIHPDLFEAVPGMRRVDYTGEINPDFARYEGTYYPKAQNNPLSPQGMIDVKARDMKELTGITEHEVTHGVQERHGLAPGSSPDTMNDKLFGTLNALGGTADSPAETAWRKKLAYEAYQRDLGENFANAAKYRSGFNTPKLNAVNPEMNMERSWGQLLTPDMQDDPRFLVNFLRTLKGEGDPLATQGAKYFNF